MSQPRRLIFANSLDYARLTGGFVYNTRLMRVLVARGWEVAPLDLPAGFPRPDEVARARSGHLLSALPDGTLVVADQICLSPLAGILEREAQRLRLVMIFHHPIAMEEGLPAAERAWFMAAERAALACCRAVVVTSRTTADTLVADYGVPAEQIVVALPPPAALTAGRDSACWMRYWARARSMFSTATRRSRFCWSAISTSPASRASVKNVRQPSWAAAGLPGTPAGASA